MEKFHQKRVLEKAADVFENREIAKKWLKTPLFHLQGQAPLDLLEIEAGAREIEKLLGRIEHGIFS